MKNNFYISFGVWIAILPFLGIPGTWRNTLITLSGLFLVLVSLGPTILRKLQIKSKPKKKQDRSDSQNSLSQNEGLRFSVPVEDKGQMEESKHED